LLTLADHIRVVENDFPHPLVSKYNIGHVKHFTGHFPYDITRDVGFESHLAENRGWADFLFSVTKQSSGAKILAGDFPFTGLPPSLVWQYGWKKIHYFAKEWITPGSFFNQYIGTIWFEFDHKDDSLSEIPKMFLGIAHSQGQSSLNTVSFASDLQDNFSRIFSENPINSDLRQQITRCITFLPERAKLYHFGFYLSKELAVVRLVLIDIEFQELIKYLEAINWSGDFDRLQTIFNEIKGRFDYFVYNLDVGGEIYPNLGIECYLSHMAQPSEDARWESNLAWMVEKGWCLPKKKDGLLHYSGSHLVEHFYKINYLNSVNHIKIVFKNTEVAAVKAYFGTYIRNLKL
jgi:hypothetical protein